MTEDRFIYNRITFFHNGNFFTVCLSSAKLKSSFCKNVYKMSGRAEPAESTL